MQFSESFFAARFGITRQDLETYLAEALSHGGDYADLYFEYLATSSISIDESIVKSATAGRLAGRRRARDRGRTHRLRLQRRSEPREDPQSRARGRAASPRVPPRSRRPASKKARSHNLYPMLTAPTRNRPSPSASNW